MKGKGLLLNDNYELQVKPMRDGSGKIAKGFVVGETLYQNQALVLIVHPGEVKQMPEIGVAISDVALDNDFLGWRRRIRQHMELDGQTVNDVVFSLDKTLMIDAGYNN